MKNSTKNNFAKKLLKYGALSAAIAGVADASGQVVYTDVDPDFSAGLDESYTIDLNNDGIGDFLIGQTTGTNGTINALVFNIPASNSAVAASNGAIGFNSTYNYPSNLSSGVPVSSGQTFVNSVGTFNFSSCAYPNSQWCGGVTDGYMGVQFIIDGATHYGWVRMDMAADASSFVVKDFAYESTAGEPINTSDGQLGVESQAFQGFNYFVKNDNLNLKASSPMQSVSLYNMLGQQVKSETLNKTDGVLDLSSLSAGVYIAKVSIDGNTKSFKIVKK